MHHARSENLFGFALWGDASVRQLNPVNGMSRRQRARECRCIRMGRIERRVGLWITTPREQDAQDSGGNADSDGDVYAGAPAILFNERSRHVHRPRPHPQPHPHAQSHGPDR